MAISQYYVDPFINANSGAGTIGDPYGDLQYALNSITQNTTDGDQVNIKSGTAEVLAASLDLTTYGTPGTLYPLVLRGYTSSADDGGMGEIDCGGFTMWANSALSSITMADLELHNFGDNNGIELTNRIVLFRCKIHSGVSTVATAFAVSVGDSISIAHCEIYDYARAIYCSEGFVGYNYIHGCDYYGLIYLNKGGTAVIGNIIHTDTADVRGILSHSGGYDMLVGNVVYNSAGGTVEGIYMGTADARHMGILLNNIVVGYSGVGGVAVAKHAAAYLPQVIGHNAFYNNTTDYGSNIRATVDLRSEDVALAADPFTDAANGDFSLTAAAKTALEDAGFPTSYFGAHANTTSNLLIGPIQNEQGAAAAGAFRRVARILGG